MIWIIILSLIILIFVYSLFPSYLLKKHGTPFNKKPGEGKFICLTFDDGPDNKYTNKLLDLLNEYNVKATFFVVAKHAKRNPQIIERMKREGHCIGLHSLNHKNALFHFPIYTHYDFNNSIKIMHYMNTDIKFFRPPWGNFNLSTLFNIKKYRLRPVLWDVMAEDWKGNTTSEIIKEKLIRRVSRQSVICLHDGRGKNEAPKRTIEALSKTLPVWIEKGYKFLKVDELYE